MNPTDTTFERFTSAIGDKIRDITGLEDVYYERSRHAGFPRVIYTATVWTNNDALRGTPDLHHFRKPLRRLRWTISHTRCSMSWRLFLLHGRTDLVSLQLQERAPGGFGQKRFYPRFHI